MSSDAMTFDEFFTAVANMRTAQREYFRTPSSTALEKSKRLERAVDELLKRIANRQPQLFD